MSTGPSHVDAALTYLKKHNDWYSDIAVTENNIFEVEKSDQSCSEGDKEQTDIENDPEHDDEIQSGVQYDTCLQPVDIGQEVLDHYFDDIYNIAPAEGKNPVRMLQENGNEAKSFPHLFPNGKNTGTKSREKRITLSKYFNYRLMVADNRFAKDIDYIFLVNICRK